MVATNPITGILQERKINPRACGTDTGLNKAMKPMSLVVKYRRCKLRRQLQQFYNGSTTSDARLSCCPAVTC